MIFVLWIVFAFVVGAIGSDRKIGFLGAFLLSTILSPIIGLIIVLASGSKSAEETKAAQQTLVEESQRQTAALENLGKPAQNLADQLKALADLRQSDAISEEEYRAAKAKVLGSQADAAQ